MIGIILAIAVWIYFEFYRIPKLHKHYYSSMETLFNEWNNEFPEKFDSNFDWHKKNIKEAIDEIWEKIDELEQIKDVGTKISPKAVSRN